MLPDFQLISYSFHISIAAIDNYKLIEQHQNSQISFKSFEIARKYIR